MSILDLIVKGGFLMYVLTVISVISIGIIIEKYRQFRKVRIANNKLIESLKSQDKLENIRALINLHQNECPMGIMLYKLFNSPSDDLDLINQSMEATANLELHKLERGLGWLSTFAAIAPLIGFLGTVLGMVNVFMKIQAANQSGVDISMLAGGIWVALLTTVGGLIVGIFTIIFYNDLVQKLENIVKDMQDNAIEHIIKYKKIMQGKL
ncbi:MAG TPA: MotA/TolQ/ExbB proton channel family protein [Candidatus Cloacimonas sp.]|jgi:biopolymer transport protein ExbB|nr:MotA/TolQ/ExbB proton channel family protein [Candidatus Cloacimonas sp.]MDD2250312.1 MotA/TolQ/ExbB proton channel family protein [Candidatus Cloacimonadota bacterium]MCK9165421.1 MotA/TolQ/ExbB proton channel family protein [Candidatus Cloacimonas sp.]MDD3733894.1 MotA/TolQ/ExbB proton channel family protein [Candidatus Cloacimonadota bacterium]MDD4677204.1 MotA/TolQ/ExbB proton channel family protein [Candidatus Cloacimonadota bacterium]